MASSDLASPPPRRLRLRYAGRCVSCGAALDKGTEAFYDAATHTVRCIECPTEVGDSTPVDAGTAGASAQREYERRKDKREERVKERFGRRLGGVILAVTDEPQPTRAWARGARGEEEFARSLADVPGISVLHDRKVAGTRGNIDHLVIAPAGVFVVDAKLYEGEIRVRDRGGLFRTDLRLYVGSRDCSKLADNMTWQVEAVKDARARSGAGPDVPIVPVLCFVRGEWPLLFPPDSFRGVRLASPRSVLRLATATEVLDAQSVEDVTRLLAAVFPPK